MNDNREERIDLSPLDPNPRMDRVVRRIMDRAAFELARRRQRRGALFHLARWERPMAAAAVLALIVSYGIMVGIGREASPPPSSTLAEYIGVPDQIAQWVGEDNVPAVTEVLFLPTEDEP